MITDEVIKEIYKKFNKPPRDRAELNLEQFVAQLQTHHGLFMEDDEIIVKDLEEFSPFRRFLIRSLNAVLDFDRWIAFVFKNHILFFSKNDKQMQVHIKPQRRSIFNRIFGR